MIYMKCQRNAPSRAIVLGAHDIITSHEVAVPVDVLLIMSGNTYWKMAALLELPWPSDIHQRRILMNNLYQASSITILTIYPDFAIISQLPVAS